MSKKLCEFDNYVGLYAVGRLSYKLQILIILLVMQSEMLITQHDGMGSVCLLCKENAGFSIYWVETKEIAKKIVADKAWFATCGFNVFSIDETITIFVQKLVDLNSGNWSTVLDWFKKYGKVSDPSFA
jgi:hypothetical protein